MKYKIEDTGECIVIHVLDSKCRPAITIMTDMTFEELIEQLNDIQEKRAMDFLRKKITPPNPLLSQEGEKKGCHKCNSLNT